MKLYIIPILLLFIFNACEPQAQKEVSQTEMNTVNQINNIDLHELEILEIDNCEYIFYKKTAGSNRGFGFMAHKGNCKNTIHAYNNITLSVDTIQ